MIGIVLVSHSRALATALLGLARQVALPEVPIAIAAGVGTNRAEFGTDAVEIYEAIESVYTPDGVLVLMDLGSAILSAEMALELLPPEMRAHIRFCPAPLVEGTITAAVQAGLGSSLATVYDEARQALLPKLAHLGDSPSQVSVVEKSTTGLGVALTLQTEHGLHARPAAKFVQTAGRFDAHITVNNLTTGKGPVSAKSLNALATLGALYGHTIQIVADGPQAEAALSALTRLVADDFGEPRWQGNGTPADSPPREVSAPLPETRYAPGEAISAIPIAEGIAIGTLGRIESPPPPIPTHPVDDPEKAWERLQIALAKALHEVHHRRNSIAARAGEEQAGIFDAHALILQDPDMLETARQQIFDERKNEAAAWDVTIRQTADLYKALADPYLRQRAVDVLDVGNQVLYALAGSAVAQPVLTNPVVLVAEDLTPTQTAQLEVDKVLGLITLAGGPTSHSAILARSLGIPAISSAPTWVLHLPENTVVAVDGFRGELWVSPKMETLAELETRREAWLKQRSAWLETSQQHAVTQDDRAIEIVANVGILADAIASVKNGAEGIGLLRTEFLFLSRTTAPDEEEQYEALREIFEVMGSRPVIVRTMDVGGDKPLAYISQPVEANPFLGVRGLRLSLQRPDLFTTQLRAILRAGAGHTVRIMFPMVSNLDEVLRARQMLAEAHAALKADGWTHAWPVETGIMIEVPSAALLAPVLAPHVDFFSVGTNDLTQYTLAAERGNPNLPGFADALHPAVLKLIGQVVEAAEAHGKWVGVCGELAGDPVAAPVLIGLGVKELSLNPAGIPRIKDVIRKSTFAEAQPFAQKVLLAEDAPKARKLAENFLV